MRRQPIGAIESPDGGEWHVIFTEAQKRAGWTFHAGMTSVPGPPEPVKQKTMYELAKESATVDEFFTKMKAESAKDLTSA